MGLGVYSSDNCPLVLHNSVTYVNVLLLNCVFVFSLLLVSWHSDTISWKYHNALICTKEHNEYHCNLPQYFTAVARLLHD